MHLEIPVIISKIKIIWIFAYCDGRELSILLNLLHNY